MASRIIAHVDMDSFYASVEMRDNPDLKGQPVIVGADPASGRGVVSTCSYEARKFGVHSGMPISSAYQCCPGGVYIRPQIPRYAEVSRSIMGIIGRLAPDMEQVSIDEAYLDLSGTGSYETATAVAGEIKKAIHEEEQLTCSIGIAPSRSYAKMASDMHKPDGLVIIHPDTLKDQISGLLATSIPGIGKKARSILDEKGIRTIGDLAGTDIQTLQEIFGSAAVALHRIASGEDDTGLNNPGPRKSIGREITFPEDTNDEEILIATLDQLAVSVHLDLLIESMVYKTLTIKIRYSGFITTSHARSLHRPTDSFTRVRNGAQDLFQQNWTGEPVRLIGVRLSGLSSPEPFQKKIPDFFPDSE